MPLERALDLPLRVPVRNHAALVGALATLGDRELDLHAAVLEVHADGNERQALLTHLPVERVDLLAVEQKLPVPVRLMA